MTAGSRDASEGKWLKPLAFGLLGAGLLVPPRPVAEAAVGLGAADLEDLTLGIWLLKLSFGALALWLLFLRTNPGFLATGTQTFGRPGRDDTGSLWVWSLLVAALAVRLVALGQGLWYDEILTLANFTRMPFLGLATTFDSNNHLLYSVASRASTLLLGESAWALRLPAVLFGVASLWALFRFATQVASRKEALIVTAALAFSYHHLWFSQNARGYTALLFFTILSTSALITLIRGNPERPLLAAVGYWLSTVFAGMAHLTGLFVLGSHGLVWLALAVRHGVDRVRLPLVGLIGATVLCGIAYAPLIPQVLEAYLGPQEPVVSIAWRDAGWMVAETARGLVQGLPGGWVALALGGLMAGVGLWSFARSDPAVLALMLLPGVLCAVALTIASQNLWPRFFFFVAGFAGLVAVRGVLRSGALIGGAIGTRLATGALVIGVGSGAALIPSAWGPKQDFAGAADYISGVSGEEEAVVTLGLTTLPFITYLELPWDSVTAVGELEAIERANETTRLVLTFPVQVEAAFPEIWARLQRFYVEERVFPGTVGGGEVVVMVRQ